MDIEQLNETYRTVNGLSRDGLFHPEVILPSQFFDAIRPNLRPEKRLLLACLEDAVGVLQRFCLARNPAGRAFFDETMAWVRAHDEHWPCSFVCICDALNLEPSHLRTALLARYAQYETITATTPQERTRGCRTLAATPYTIHNVCVLRLTMTATVYKLATGGTFSINSSRIWSETTAWMPGETGDLVISLKHARERRLVDGELPPHIKLRRQVVGRLDQGVHLYHKKVGRGRRMDLVGMQ